MPRLPATTRWLAALALVAAAAGAAVAVDLGTTTIKLELRLPTDEDGTEFALASEIDRREFFNRANCLCPEETFAIRLSLENASESLEQASVALWVGSGCDTELSSERDVKCIQLPTGFSDIEELRDVPDVEISVRDLISAGQAAGEGVCPERLASRGVYALIDENDDGIGEGDYSFSYGIETDSQPPTMVSDIVARGGEGAVAISWTLPTAAADLQWFQLLCERVGEANPADQLPRKLAPRYLTPRMIDGCSASDDGFRAEPAAGAATPASEGLLALDERFLCGEAAQGATSITVGGLENGVAYRVVLVVIDPARNPTAVDLGEVEPQPAVDFWEDYKARGGAAEGGCAAGGGAGGLGAAAVAGLCLALRRRRAVGLARRPRRAVGLARRPRRAVGAAAALAALAAAAAASAQPYLETRDPAADAVAGGAPVVDWNLELALGPYLPAVDDSAPAGEHPFADMFGDGPFLLGHITLDRFLLHRFGLLGLTASAGYLATSAAAYQDDGTGGAALDDGKPVRTGDRTGFRMLPTTVGLVYRYGDLDDLLGIPLVPYGRVGLSYYLWWITQPSGDIAEAPTPACPDPGSTSSMCTGERARGGTLGWQGTVGLALRAERLDPDSESGLRNELGIAHAGFFAELTYADVDGFGSAKKLPLGDLAWSAGLTFEF